jgi:hypothetical protein
MLMTAGILVPSASPAARDSKIDGLRLMSNLDHTYWPQRILRVRNIPNLVELARSKPEKTGSAIRKESSARWRVVRKADLVSISWVLSIVES